MDITIDTKVINQSLKNGSLMPYFLNSDNELIFKENMKELYVQLEQEYPDSLVFENKKITEKDWNDTKFVGSFFTSLFCHWAKIIKSTNIFFVEISEDFPNELQLELDEDSFVLFYKTTAGMISKRDECIYDTNDDWINDFFNWLYNEIVQVGNISNLFQKYKAFTEIFTNDDFDPEDENAVFEFPEELYSNIEDLKRSIIAALEEEIEDGNSEEHEKLLASIREELENHKVVSFPPTNVKFTWNEQDIELNFPLDISDSLINKKVDLQWIDNNNAWLALQSTEIQETTFALWAEFIYTKYLESKVDKKETFSTNWLEFAEDVRNWLRQDTGLDVRKIDKKIRTTQDKLMYGGKLSFFHYADTPENFIRTILFIEKNAAICAKKQYLIDVENVQNQYFYALENENVLSNIWGAIIHEKIQKNKCRKTFAHQFDILKDKFPNFKDVIDYYSGAMYIFEQTGTPPAPILLLGSPGLGKTHFSNEIAKVVGSQMTVIPVSSLTAGWIISGSAAQWKDAQMGKIATSLLNGNTASPVIVLDEIDKKSEGNFDPLGALYPLLEYQTAKEFVDEYLEFPIDASNVIWVATANSLNTIPEPILDRFVVFDIAKLSPTETIKVANNIFSDLTNGLNPENLSEDILDILKDKTPRQIKQILKKALAYAAVQRTQNIVLRKEHLDLKTKIKKIGF